MKLEPAGQPAGEAQKAQAVESRLLATESATDHGEAIT